MARESKLKSPDIDNLFKAIRLLETEEECYRFFEDICTVKELQVIAQRFQVAKMLAEKKTYNEIETATGASTATISRVNRSLAYGEGGYDVVLKRWDK
jgi:TrpR-related protein YerC/YecD